MIPQAPYDQNTVYDVDIDSIFSDSDFNCRGSIDPSSVLELAKSIREKGLSQPIVLEPYIDTKKPRYKFKIIMGHRRFKAVEVNRAYATDESSKQKYSTIRSLIKEGLSELDARILNLTENIQRQELNIKQEAFAIDPFRRAGWSREEVARRVSMSVGWVQVRFMLLDLPEEIQDEAAAGMLNQVQIRNLHALPSAHEQFEYVKRIKDAKIKGNKKEPKPDSVVVKNEKRLRTYEEMEELQGIVREHCGGNGFGTKLVAFCMGEISDLQVHTAIKEEADRLGKFYMIPEGLIGRKISSRPVEERLEV